MEPAGAAIILTAGIICFSLVCGVGVIAVSLAIPFFIMRSNQKRAEALMATGKQGEATVLQLNDTGMRINDDPRVALLLEVRIPGYPAYQVQKTSRSRSSVFLKFKSALSWR